jgi:hypothetical protein
VSLARVSDIGMEVLMLKTIVIKMELLYNCLNIVSDIGMEVLMLKTIVIKMELLYNCLNIVSFLYDIDKILLLLYINRNYFFYMFVLL